MNKLGWLIFLLFSVYFIFLIRQDIINNLDLKKQVRLLQKKQQQEEVLATALKGRLSRLKGDDLIEELARTRLGMVKKDETAYKVIR